MTKKKNVTRSMYTFTLKKTAMLALSRAKLETAMLDDMKFDMVLPGLTWGLARSYLATYLVLAQLGLPRVALAF